MIARAYALDAIERSPGIAEAGVRSELRASYGSSSALDELIAEGAVRRCGHKLYRVLVRHGDRPACGYRP